MKRKNFIQASTAIITASYLPALPKIREIEEPEFMSPPTLKSGDLIGITAPAGYITHEEIQSAVKKMESWGYKIKVGDTIDKKDFTFGGTDPQKEYLVDGKAYKAEVEFNGANIISVFTDKSGWTINPMMGGTDAQAMPDELYKAGKSQIYFGGGLVNYAAKGYKAELVGKEGDAFKIKLSDGGTETFYFIDSKTYLLTKSVIKSEMMGQSIDVTTTYSDHKKTDFGVTLAYSKNIDMGMLQLSQKTNKLEINKEIDMKIFDMPK